MANFPKSPPAIGRSTGLQGLQGATGAAGAGTISGVVAVDSLSGTPRSVADWGALINTAVTGGARNFEFGPYTYPYSTYLNFKDVDGIVLQGAGRIIGATGFPVTELRWTGTGAGNAIDWSKSTPSAGGGAVMADMIVTYSSASYTGDLITFHNAFYATFERLSFMSVGAVIKTARCALRLGGMNTFVADECDFWIGFQTASRGRESTEAFANVVRFNDCTFHDVAVVNPSLDWVLDHCILEMSNLAANASMITTDMNYDLAQLTLRSCAYWDPGTNAATNRVLDAPAANNVSWDFEADACKDHANSNQLAGLYRFASPNNVNLSSIKVRGGNAANVIDVGNASTASKSLVSITGVQFSVDGLLVNAETGHTSLEISGNTSLTTSGIHIDGTRNVSSERITNLGAGFTQWSPAITYLYAAGTLSTFQSAGNDIAGYIVIKNTGAGVSSTGKIADVTFNRTFTSVNSSVGLPCVVISAFTPFSVSDSYWTCQPTILTTVGAQKFTVYINVGIPAGQTIGLAYRMIYL